MSDTEIELHEGKEFDYTGTDFQLFIDGELENVDVDYIEIVSREEYDGSVNLKVAHYNRTGEKVKTISLSEEDIQRGIEDNWLQPRN